MTGASKILTVSYGTFSCTLEGFDDPFNTMKAIAEYFRDLAAEDRYFGAEPPVPDAAMLHRIAEREIQRRVEAKIQENGVILRAAEDMPAAAPAVAASVAAAPAPQITIPAAEPAPAPRPVLMPVAEAAPQVETAAARLSRLRAEAAARQAMTAPVVAAPVAEAPVEAPAPLTLAEDQPIPAVILPFETYDEDEAAVLFDAEPLPSVDFDAEAVAEAEAEPVDVLIETPDQPAAEVEDVLAAVMAEAETAPLLDEALDLTGIVDQAETIQPEATQDDDTSDLMETLSGLMADAPILPEPEAQDAPAPSIFADDETEEAIAGPDADFSAEIEVEPAVEADTGIEAEPVAEVATDLDAEPVAEPAAELAAVFEPTPVPAPEMAPDAAVDGDAAGKAQRARARVIRVRRIEPARPLRAVPTTETEASDPTPDFLTQEPAGEPGEIERAEQALLAATQNDVAPVEVEPVLSAEAEAQLAAELAALEQEAAPVAVEPAAEPVTLSVVPSPEIDAPAEPKPAAPVSEDAVSRLLQQTNSALEVPETKRRRSAIEHLKAAVRATIAERKVNPRGDEAQSEARAQPYRSDLDSVVRPNSAAAQAQPPARAGDKPPPLVLVSAQRIDRRSDAPAPTLTPVDSAPAPAPAATAIPQPAPAQPGKVVPVSPRRIRAGGLAVDAMAEDFDDEDLDEGALIQDASKLSFADFVEQVGGSSLAELLEAAAAYNAVVLDRPQFPRQMLFRQLETLPSLDVPSREDGLRSFGKLLREGRIVKTKRGQFGLPDESPALNEAKRLIG